ncbi:alpha/beta hydrolase [Pseudoxanthomonas sp.]|uniref:alpha/beta hydrolase n=1 Tax=Pseudoxanthomonas sp. TaxID=1871049 RepID=UPI002FE2CF10
MIRKLIVSLLLLVLAGVIGAVYVTPWPSVLATRYLFDRGAEEAAARLAPRVPDDVGVTRGLVYDAADSHALLDIYRGRTVDATRPTIVWFHGGGFVSGRRDDIANYLKILAGRGFTVVNVDYTIAPEATYPAPIRQANRALAYLSANRTQLGINADRFVLAGDSAGSQIAAQTAAMLTNPAYARLLEISPGVDAGQVAGALLFCGVYDLGQMGEGGGVAGWFVNAAAWAYSGRRDWREDERFRTMSLPPHLTPAFPRTFISAGNADPLEPQSRAMAQALHRQGVSVTEVFYPADYAPPLAHEYQFDLGTAAGRGVLDAAVAWLTAR